jgi:hypothetical protein
MIYFNLQFDTHEQIMPRICRIRNRFVHCRLEINYDHAKNLVTKRPITIYINLKSIYLKSLMSDKNQNSSILFLKLL